MNKKKRNILIAIGLAIIIVAIIILVSFLTRKDITYTVKFNTNGGSNVSSLEIKEKDLIKKPDDPTKEGYTFAGWYLNDELFDFKTPIKENLTLEARWNENVPELSLNATNLTLNVGEEATLKANVTQDLTWKSSDESIVTISENGKLKALKTGRVTITVTDKNGQSVTCKISVTEKKNDEVEVTKVEITGHKEVTVGSKIKLTVKITPSNATDKKVTWKSSNTKIAKVDKNGNVTGVKAGNVTITVTSENGKSASVSITVKAKASTSTGTNSQPSGGSTSGGSSSGSGSTSGSQTGGSSTGGSSSSGSGSTGGETTKPEEPKNIPITSIEISGTKTVEETKTITLSATVKPNNTTEDKTVTWRSKDERIAKVDKNTGKVTGVKEGSTYVCAKAGNVEKCVAITVTEKVNNYAIHFKREYSEDGTLVSYFMTATKNGSALPASEFVAVLYRGPEDSSDVRRRWKLNTGAIPKTLINESNRSGKIIVKVNGTERTYAVTISYGN